MTEYTPDGERIFAAAADAALLSKITTIVQQWRRKMWSDAQAIGSIDAAIAKAHLKKGDKIPLKIDPDIIDMVYGEKSKP